MSQGKRKSILIIESPGEDRKVIGDFLHALGYNILYADKGTEGVRTFHQDGPDLVLVEILLSGMNGLSVCKMIKDQAEWAKVVVLSKLYQSHQMRKESKVKYKADGYLEKPFELVELRDLVRRLIGESAAGSQDLPEDSALRAEMLRYRRGAQPPVGSEPEPRRPEPIPEPEPAPYPPIPERPPFPDLDAPAAQVADDDTRPDATPGGGVFDSETLARMLRELTETRFSGTLKLVAGELAKIVYFAEGTPVYVKSNLRSESLGSMLLADQTISEDVYAQAMSLMKRTGKKLGTVLVGMKVLTPEELGERIAQQTGRKLAGVFTWEGGTYELETRSVDQLGAPHFPSSTARVLSAAFDRQAGGQDFALRLAADASRVCALTGGRMAAEAGDVATEVDRAVLAAIDGTRTARQVVDASGAPGPEATRALYRLMTLGAVRLSDADAPPAVDPAPSAAADSPFDDLGYVPEKGTDAGFEIPPDPVFESEPPFDPGPVPAIDDELPPSDPSLTGEMELELEGESPRPEPVPDAYENPVLVELRDLAARMTGLDDYELLSIAEDDPAKQISQAYRELCERFDADALPADATDADRTLARSVCSRAEIAYENIKAERRARRKAAGDAEETTHADASPSAVDDERRNAAESELAYQEGIALLSQRAFQEAITKLEFAAKRNPEEADYQAMLGWAIYRMLREQPRTVDEAMGLVKRALVLNAQSDQAHLLMARMYAGEEDEASAIKFYRKTLSINPENEDAKSELRELERDAHLKSTGDDSDKPWYKKKLW